MTSSDDAVGETLHKWEVPPICLWRSAELVNS